MIRINEAAFLRLVRGESRGIGPTLARFGLAGIAGLYRLEVARRNLAFDQGWKARHRVGVPVVSVGNLTLGGTGKTPMVEWIAKRYRSRGLRVAILSRGYGDPSGMNDEGLVLEANLPDVPHLQGTDRVALANCALEELESEVLVLDDGFQHRRLARDLDVVLLDALEPFGLGRIFPRGLLREPVGSLRRAGVVVLSRADLVEESTRRAIVAEAERRAGPRRWAFARHAPLDLIDALGASVPLAESRRGKVAAFCGIGNPEGFRRTLGGLGIELAGFRAFPDHHPYQISDVAQMAQWCRTLGVELALTTQKDLVKLRISSLGEVPLRALRIGLDVMEGSETLEQALSEALTSGKEAP